MPCRHCIRAESRGQLAGKPIKHDQLSISCAVGVGRWPLPTEIGTRDSNRDSKFTPLERRHTDRTEMSYFEHRLVSPLVHIHPDVDYARCGARVHEVRGRREKTAPERCSALPSEALYAASCNHVATSAQTCRKRSTCGTGVPITISMAHSTKRTAIDSHHCGEQKVALMGWSEVGSAMLKGGRGCSSNHSYSSSEEQVAIGEAQTSTPGEPRKAKQACRDQPKGWRRRRLSEQLQPRSSPSLRKSHLDARRFAVNTKTKIAVRLVTHEICAHYCVASRHLSKNGARMENARLLGATLVSPVRIGRDGKVCVGQSRLS